MLIVREAKLIFKLLSAGKRERTKKSKEAATDNILKRNIRKNARRFANKLTKQKQSTLLGFHNIGNLKELSCQSRISRNKHNHHHLFSNSYFSLKQPGRSICSFSRSGCQSLISSSRWKTYQDYIVVLPALTIIPPRNNSRKLSTSLPVLLASSPQFHQRWETL